jgi:Sulfatase
VFFVVVDVISRHETLLAFDATERQQYAFSAFASLFFWNGVGAWFSRAPRLMQIALGLVCVTLVSIPYLVWLNLGRFPNHPMALFLANEAAFASRMVGSYFKFRELGCLFLVSAALVALAVVARRSPMPVFETRVAGLGSLLVAATISVSTVAVSHPLMPEQNSMKLAALLVAWGRHPPTFFHLKERITPEAVLEPSKTPLSVNVLLIVGESFGADYLQSPTGEPITPALLSVLAAPEVTHFWALHSNSTCTDVSVPSLLSGLSPFAPSRDFQMAWLPFDEAVARGALTFVSSAHRYDWANLEAFLVPTRFQRFIEARHFDAQVEVDGQVPDTFAYQHALGAMQEAARLHQPFMGLIHINTLHGPYWPNPAHSPFQDSAGFSDSSPGFVKYLNALVNFDDQLGAFWNSFSNEPFFENTLVIFTADHGEAFGQHGLYSHCNSFFPEETHVPAFIRLPASLALKRSILRETAGDFATNADLIPTLYELLEWPALPTFAGHSLLHHRDAKFISVFSNCNEVRQCSSVDWGFQQGRLRWSYAGATKTWTAYDVEEDALGKYNLASQSAIQLKTALQTLAPVVPAAQQFIEASHGASRPAQ